MTAIAPAPVFVHFTPHVCGACGIHFALESTMNDRRLEDGKDFFCPNGCRIHFIDTENKRLKEQLDSLTRQLDGARKQRQWAEERAKASERRASAARGVVTRIRHRVGNGVCPCCHRTFANLARHMAGKHPGYKKTR